MVELIGLLIFLSASALAIPNLVRIQQHSHEQMLDGTTAAQLVEIAQAANQFIQANYPELVATAGTQTISIAQLQAAGDLSPDATAINPYEQTWEVQINQPTAGDLQGVILALGGVPMTQTEQGDAAAQTHGIGGFIPFAANGSTANATGAFGGWEIPMAAFTNPGSGHMVGLLTFANGQLINNDYLYRVSIGGQPQLNTMQTTLDAGGNNITNANNVGTDTLTATGQVTAGSGAALLTDDPGVGGLEELTGSNGNVAALLNENGNLDALVNNNSTLGFQIATGGQFQTNQTITPGAVASAGAGCSPNGAIAGSVSGNGQILDCVNGVWSSFGGFTQSFQMGVGNGEGFTNTSGGPEFVSTFCQPTPSVSGFLENVTIDVFGPPGLVSNSQGQVQEGGSDANFSAAPSTSAIVPAGDAFSVSGDNMNCSVMVTE
jgi:hypothetical protein